MTYRSSSVVRPDDRRGVQCLLYLYGALLFAIAVIVFCESAGAQSQSDQLVSGEAFVTRFSGTTTQGGRTVIDTAGTVGSVIDIRQPGETAQGQHWLNESQRLAVMAGEIGQVFGIAFDDASSPNIYLTATSANRTP